MSNEARHPVFSLLGFLTLSFGAGFLAAQGTLQGLSGWYQLINKPDWNPPAWVFAPVWTLLYALIAVAGWQIWRSREPNKKPALVLFSIQLVLNMLWTWLFFAFHLFFASAVEIGILWIVIGLTTFFFARIKKSAGILLVPYLAWVLFAATLNFAIWRLNSTGAKIEILTGTAVPHTP